VEAARGKPTWRVRLERLPALLRAAAFALLIVAVARPQQGLALTTIPEEGIDIVVALDVSSSMGQATPDGMTRLGAARSVVEEFVSTLQNDRVGLVIFQSRALTLSPLTLDSVALRRAVRDVRSGLLVDGTAIGLGLAESLNLLRDSPARSRVVVLLTDGQNNTGAVEPVAAAELAEALGVRVYTIGFLSGAGGVSDVDVATLQRIASTTGAQYYDAATEAELATAYGEIGALERSLIGERRFRTFREFAPWLAGAAFALLTAELILRTTALRRYP
jgi:Ca-activated chloride channel family protein